MSARPPRLQAGPWAGLFKQALRLIDEILDLSRFEAGQVRLDPRDFSVENVIDGIAGKCTLPDAAAVLANYPTCPSPSNINYPGIGGSTIAIATASATSSNSARSDAR